MLLCGLDGDFLGHVHAIATDSDGTEHVYYHYYFEGELFYDTHCLTPGLASPVILIQPE